MTIDHEQGVFRTVTGRVVQGVIEGVVEILGAVTQPQQHAGHCVGAAIHLPFSSRIIVVDRRIWIGQTAVEAAQVAPFGHVVDGVGPGQRHDHKVIGRPAIRWVSTSSVNSVVAPSTSVKSSPHQPAHCTPTSLV